MLHRSHFFQCSGLFALTMLPLQAFAQEVNISAMSKIVSWSSQYNNSTWAANNLLDGKTGVKHEWASTKNPSYPQDIIIDLSQSQSLKRVAINPMTSEHKSRWSKEVSLFTSQNPQGPWQALTNYQLLQENRYQSVNFDAIDTRYLKVSIDSNWGGDYTELGEIQLFAKIKNTVGKNDQTTKLTEVSKNTTLVSWTSQFNETTWAATNLLDGKLGSRHEWASIANPKYPHRFVFSLSANDKQIPYLTRVDIHNQTSEQSERWSKDISIEVGNSSKGPWLNVADYQLKRDSGYQEVIFAPHKAKYMRLSIHSNWGGTYTELAEIKLFSAINGQSIPPMSPPTAEIEIANNRNVATVINGPKAFAQFTLNQPTVITKINTYHWNNGKGTPSPGKIGIRQHGSWQAKGLPGMTDAPNAEWWIYPNITLPIGTYTITNSDAATWSQNQGSEQVGHFRIYGYQLPNTQ